MKHEYFSDSTLTNISFTNEHYAKRPLSGNLHNKDRSKRYHAGPKKSLSEFLERKSLFRKKPRNKESSKLRSPKKSGFKSCNVVYNAKGDGDHNKSRHMENKVNFQETMGDSEAGVFPFKSTPSGNYKLKPSQIIYESKNLSIVAADPAAVSLNITESEVLQPEAEKKPFVDNWTTTCLYTTVGKADLAFSDFDSTSDSDRGDPSSELSLGKMGYVTDNMIDWSNLCLPKKSDLKKVLLHNILNLINPDIQVKIGNKIHKCHRIVLQCYSTFFASKTASQVELPENYVTSEVFTLIYQWMMHMGTDSYRLLRRDNILLIFKAAQYLGIKELEDQCWAFIDNLEIFCEDKAFLLYLDARKLGNRDVMELMVPRIQRFFLTLVSSKEFVEFSADEVCMFLESNYICVHCEEEVFMAGVRWLRHDWSARKIHAAKIMSCVRFGLINPKLLLAMRREKSSPEFKPIVSIPEVGKMVEDGLSIQILKLCFVNESAESIEKSKQNLNLEDPAPRNWAGIDRCYSSYSEFMRDLVHYRSKQRLEIKKSKIKCQIERVDKDGFLATAVLPADCQQKISMMNADESCLMECVDLGSIRDMMCQESLKEDDDRKRVKRQLISMASEEYDRNPRDKNIYSYNKKSQTYHMRESSRNVAPSLAEQDEAARKIQRAYRNHSRRTIIKSSSLLMKEQAARKIQRAYRQYSSKKLADGADQPQSQGRTTSNVRWRSRSDPSLPSGLTKSSTLPSGKYGTDLLPLKMGRETVFIFGGSNPFDDCDETGYCIYAYDMDCNDWRKVGEMPEARHYHSIAYFQGKIYVAGGKHPAKYLTEPGAISRKVWRYDPNYKAWSRLKDMIYARRSFGLVGCDGKLYVIGGRNEGDRIMSNVEKFDPASNSWVVVAPMHQARAGAAISEFKGKIWVAGGLISDNTIATNSVEFYNCQKDLWTEVASLRYTLAYGVMVPVNNRIFVVGGAVGLQDSTLHGSGKQIDVWDPDTRAWCMAAMMAKPRHAHTAVYLRANADFGYMFIMGGMSTRHNCVTDHVEVWRVQDEQWVRGVAPLPSPTSGSAALALPCDLFG